MPSSGWSASTSGSATSPTNAAAVGDAREHDVEHDVHDARWRVDLAEAPARADRRAAAQGDDHETGERDVATRRPARQHRSADEQRGDADDRFERTADAHGDARGNDAREPQPDRGQRLRGVARSHRLRTRRRPRAARWRSRTGRRGRSRRARCRKSRAVVVVGGRSWRGASVVGASVVGTSVDGGVVVVLLGVVLPVASSGSMVSVREHLVDPLHQLARRANEPSTT